MSGSTSQTRFFSEPSGESVEIETSGRTIRPLMALPTVLVDEAKLRFDAGGLHTTAVDPANVGMVGINAKPAAFEGYHVDGADDVLIGANLTRLKSSLSDARLGKSTDDPVELDIDATRTLVSIDREYDVTTLSRTDELLNIEPESIRQEPDIPNLELSYRAELDVEAFCDAVDYIPTDHVELGEFDGHLILKGDADGDEMTRSTRIDVGDVAEPITETPTENASSIYSMDYLRDMAKGLKKAKVTSLSVRWGEEFPLMLDFQRCDDETVLYEGRYMLAPRIQSGGAE
ncbi:hypothetical protein D3D02_06785 [Halobellus sp. Atlit-38R]|uniref:hypothetical protein n=1 Tax=Halobellus sp. Atlit-38R TaxID=2282131 RepID=UPI000EF1FC8B|nr:hypothetical protein [Halobellus sp. Atlit-38R]RLM89582.1 hypothetical protein D3D02_06785 [Halobellus sp. Atlit-38R]